MTNVIAFPKKDDFPSTQEEADEKIFQVRKQFVEDVLEDVTERLYNDLSNYITLKGDGDYYKDMFFVNQALEALISRYAKIDHFMHEVIENAISLDKEEADEKEKAMGDGGTVLVVNVKETLV